MDSMLALKWSNHSAAFHKTLSDLHTQEKYADVTIACENRYFKVHKMVLSSCSHYFDEIFEQTTCKHPVIVLKDIRAEDVETLISYMYIGEANVAEERLQELMKAADCLQIRGLSVPDDDLHNYSYNKRPLVLSGKEASNKRKKKSDDINVRYKTENNYEEVEENTRNIENNHQEQDEYGDSMVYDGMNIVKEDNNVEEPGTSETLQPAVSEEERHQKPLGAITDGPSLHALQLSYLDDKNSFQDHKNSFPDHKNSYLDHHDYNSADVASQIVGGIVPVNELNISNLLTLGKTFKCPVCGKEMRSKVEFVRHYMTHTGERPFCCTFCSYKSTRKFTLLRHVRTVHNFLPK